MSTLLDVVTTLTNRKAAEALLLGGVEAREGPRDMRGCDSKNSHGTRGCRAHVEALPGLPDALRPVSRLVEVPEISRDVPAKTLTEQGAAAHMSKRRALTTVTDRRVANALLLGGVGISRDVPAKILTEQGAAAHMSKLLDMPIFALFLAGGYPRPASPGGAPGDSQGCESKNLWV